MKKYTLFIAIALSQWTTAQISGVIKDSVSQAPVPYVYIAVENENLGTNSEEDGHFTLHNIDANKMLIFSALGYQQQKRKANSVAQVSLKPMTYAIDEVVVAKRLETREREIGKSAAQTYQAFDRGPSIDTKFFPYDPAYKKTRFIKQIGLATDSRIDQATFKIHFYSVGADGAPGEELLRKDLIVSVSQGVKQTKFNLNALNLKMPKEGLFVGFEKLLIEKNKFEKTTTDPNSGRAQTQRTYYPLLLYNTIDGQPGFVFSGGKWMRQNGIESPQAVERQKVLQPVIFLVLSN